MDTKALRQKILDLAIRGKLVPQDPNDEPASVLLERIREEKKQMVKDGKLKPKDIKNDTIIFKGEDNMYYEKFQDGTVNCIEDEIPFDIPNGWEWSRIGSLFFTVTGSTPSTKNNEYYGNDYPFYKPTDLDAGYDVHDSIDHVSTAGYETGRSLPVNSVLVTCIGATIGKTGLIHSAGICNQQINALLPSPYVNSDYTFYSMCSEFEQNQIIGNASATTLPILNKGRFDNLLFIVPPIHQQIKISEEIKKILDLVSVLEENKDSLVDIISDAKSKVLDMAIRGKLAPQNPNDEPASVFIERLRGEKEALINYDKPKRDKRESIIYKGKDNYYYEKLMDGTIKSIMDEIPYELPANWTWCRIRDIASIKGGKRIPKGYSFSENETAHAYIRVTDMKYNTIIMDGIKYIDDDIYEKIKAYTISSDDLYITVAGTIGAVGTVPKEMDGMNLTENAVKATNIQINKNYLCVAIQSSFIQNQFQDKTHHVAMPKLAIERILSTLIPIPPIKEQEIIADTVANIKEHIAQIEANLI